MVSHFTVYRRMYVGTFWSYSSGKVALGVVVKACGRVCFEWPIPRGKYAVKAALKSSLLKASRLRSRLGLDLSFEYLVDLVLEEPHPTPKTSPESFLRVHARIERYRMKSHRRSKSKPEILQVYRRMYVGTFWSYSSGKVALGVVAGRALAEPDSGTVKPSRMHSPGRRLGVRMPVEMVSHFTVYRRMYV